MAKDNRARVDGPPDEDLERLQRLLNKIGGPHVVWGAQQKLDVWVAETRLEADRQATRRILAATWVLAIATIGLVVATVGLVVVTLGD